MNFSTPHNIEKVAEAIYEHDRAHQPVGNRRMPSWTASPVRKQVEYRGKAEVALETIQAIGGTG